MGKESGRCSMNKKKPVNTGRGEKFTKMDLIKDFIFFLITTACSMLWVMTVLLIISFVTLSYLHFTIEGMFITAIVCTVFVDIYYIVKIVKKYKKY